MKRSFVLFVVVVAVLSLSSVALAQDAVQVGPITQAIMDRGELICGVNPNVPGFGVVNESGEYQGIDIDFCHAVAAAVLGDANAVTFRPLNASERQAAIQGGEIDMMSRNTTWTLSRDTTWGATFGPTTFYDGQGLGTTVASGIQTMEDLDQGSICVQSGTTTELNLTDAITKRGLDIEVQTYPDAPSTWEAFVAGRCDAWTTDKSGILSLHATSEDPSAYVILDVTLSKEPLGPLSPQSDPQFADIVAWTVYGMIQAEEFGITSQNIDDFLGSEDPGINRLLGQNGEQAGSYLGIANDFMVNVIRQVGNYGEVYDRNLGVPPFNLARGINALWTDGGLMYAPPFR
ncbi:MAG: amino acid ABC transporter substrate-binding protein [Anaerolineaceae bacterium]|nr:amino acid ABC transporter substrate-binding protein [Anaerolineaceae bacterium]